MSSQSLNSVLEGYESTSPQEAYTIVLEERDALRQQNQQLWRIIEKQRAIIHQLQKYKANNSISRASSGEHSPLSPSSPRKISLSDPINDLPILGRSIRSDPSAQLATSALTNLETLHSADPISRALTLDQEYHEARKSQSMLSNKLPNLEIPVISPQGGMFPKGFTLPEPPNEPPFEQPINGELSKPHAELASENGKKFYPILFKKLEGQVPSNLTKASKSEETPNPEPTLHKAASDTSLRRRNSRGTYPGPSSSRKKRLGEGVKLTVPRRSSLRGRPESSKNSSGGPGKDSPMRIPDLRKVASNEERMKTVELFEKPDNSLHEKQGSPLPLETESTISTIKVKPSSSDKPAPRSLTHRGQLEANDSPVTSPEISHTIIDAALHTSLIPVALSRAVAGSPPPAEEESPEVESVSTHDSESVASHHSGTSFDLHDLLKGFSTDTSKKISNRSRPLKMVLEGNGLQSMAHDESQEVQKTELRDGLSRNSSHNRKTVIMGPSFMPIPASNIPEEMTADERVDFLRKEFPHLAVTLRLKPAPETNGPGVLFHLTLVGHAAHSAVKEQKEEDELPPLPAELWHLEKTWDQLTSLETQLLSTLLPKYLSLVSPLPPWPAPSPLGQGVQEFLNCIAQLPKDASGHVGDPIGLFFSTDLIEKEAHATSSEYTSKKRIYKAGNLLKRGKKLGKLMLRFFIASSSTLEYFESSEGPYLGSINLVGAQVVRSVVASLHSEIYDKYIYAITIMERKRGALIRHTFFIDNQPDWDEWIAVLELYSRSEVKNEPLPRRIESHDSVTSPTPSSPTDHDPYSSILSLNDIKTSKPSTATKPPRKDSTAEKDHSKPPAPRKTFQWNTKLFSDAFQKKSPGQHKIFGVPLEVAIAQAPIKAGYQMPSVIHRCIEYLEKHQAFLEEGIYRLSGSAADIQHLKDKFDTDGDYNLLKSGARYDIHTVAGLLKLYLREMPTYVLTQELQPEFLKVVDIQERHLRVNELGRLVCTLPLANYTLLRTLIAHLIRIVERSDVNRMTLRNIGIVFVPTLAVPAGVFNLMLAEFEFVFWVNEQGGASPKYLERAPSIYVGNPETEPNSTKAAQRRTPTSSLRDHRNSAIYRDVVPPELVTVEHGLEKIDYDSDDSSISLTEKVSNDSWNYAKNSDSSNQAAPDNDSLANLQSPTIDQENNPSPKTP